MKRLTLLIFIIFMFLFGVTTTHAMSEKKLKESMTRTFTVNGIQYQMADDNQVLLERYLNEYEVSASDADYISARVDEAISIIQASGKTSIEDLSQSTKDKLKSLVEKISANTSVKATVKNRSIVIYKPDGSGVFTEITELVKQTYVENNNMIVAVWISFIILITSAFVVVRKLKFVKNNA